MSTRYVIEDRRRKYGCGRLLLDLFLTVITGGLWLIVLFLLFLGRNR